MILELTRDTLPEFMITLGNVFLKQEVVRIEINEESGDNLFTTTPQEVDYIDSIRSEKNRFDNTHNELSNSSISSL